MQNRIKLYNMSFCGHIDSYNAICAIGVHDQISGIDQYIMADLVIFICWAII